jgi:hypothetical protein
MNNIITFFLNFIYLKNIFVSEINKLTAERLIGKKLNRFVVDKNILTTKPNPDLLEKYKNICERPKI